MKLAVLEHQRRNLRSVLVNPAALHFADENHVVAFLVAAAVMAFEPGERAVEHWHTGVALGMRDPFETISLHRREAFAQIELRRGQHVDHVVTVGAEHRHRRRARGEAPQHQRRIERNRIERAGRDADQLAGRRACRNHGDAGGELTERLFKGGLVEVGRTGALHWT